MVNDKQKAILESAGRLFSMKGFFNTSMKDIANNAGIAVGTTYLYYRNKEELLDGIYQYASSLVLERIRSRLRKISDPLEMLRVFTLESIHFSLKSPHLFMILFVDHKRRAIELRDHVIFQHFHDYMALGKTILHQGKESGVFSFPDHEDLFPGMMGFWIAMVLRAILVPSGDGLKQTRDKINNLFEQIVIHGIRS